MKKMINTSIIALISSCFIIGCGSSKKNESTGDTGTNRNTKPTESNYSGIYRSSVKVVKLSEDFPEELIDIDDEEGECIQTGTSFSCLDDEDREDIKKGTLKAKGSIDSAGNFKIEETRSAESDGVKVVAITVVQGKFTNKNEKAEGTIKGTVTFTKGEESKSFTAELSLTLTRVEDLPEK